MTHSALSRMGIVVLLLMTLLTVMLLMARMIELVMIVHIHITLLTVDAIHHAMLLIMLVIEVERIMRGCLGDWRPRGRWSFIRVGRPSIINWRSISCYVPWLMDLMAKLLIVMLTTSGLEAVWAFCH